MVRLKPPVAIGIFSVLSIVTFSSVHQHQWFLRRRVPREEANFLGLKNYTTLHSQSDYSSPAIIYQCPTGSSIVWGGTKGNNHPGISDYRTGVISTFLISLLLRMPFFVDCHVLSELYEENMIKWKWHNPGQYSAKHGPVKYLDRYNVDASFIDDVDRYVVNVVQSNRGIIASLSEEELQKWSLSRETSFVVAYNYLFKADQDLDHYLRLSGFDKTRTIPMITVQLRVGDDDINGGCRSDMQDCPIQDEKKAVVQQFVRCTTKLHSTRNLSKTSIYILSDCDCIKRQLKCIFESTLDTEVLLEEAPTVTADEYDNTRVLHSFSRALDIAATADFFIITQRSGVGRQVAARAQRFDETFWGEMGDECEGLNFNEIAQGWSGL